MIILPVGVKLIKNTDQFLRQFFCEIENSKSCEVRQSSDRALNYILGKCYVDF